MKTYLLPFLFLTSNSLLKLSRSSMIPIKKGEEVECALRDYDKYGEEKDTIIELTLDSINVSLADAISLMIFGVLGFIFCTLLLVTFIKYPKSRKQPGDLLFAITINELFIATMSIITATVYFSFDAPVKNSGLYCKITSVISLILLGSEYLYNNYFSIYLIFQLKNILKGRKIPGYLFHLLNVVILFSVTIPLYIKGYTGKNMLGTCSLKGISHMPYQVIFLFPVYLIVAAFSVYYFNKHVPHDPKFKLIKDKYLKYHYFYILSVVFVWGVQFFSYIFTALNCTKIHSPYLLVFNTLGNVSKVSTSFFLSYLRMKDPFLKQKINKIRKRISTFIFNRKESFSSDLSNSLRDIDTSRSNSNFPNNQALSLPLYSPSIEHSLKLRTESYLQEKNSFVSIGNVANGGVGSMERLETEDAGSHENWFSEIRENLKLQLIYTMITGIIYSRKVYGEEDIEGGGFKRADFKSAQMHEITPEIVKEIIPETAFEIKNHGMEVRKCQVVSYAENVFRTLQQDDKQILDLDKSLELVNNINNIKRAGQSDGGRSGEFFFFSYDNKIIIKTVNNQELKQFRKILKDYHSHFKETQPSLIAKIYGVYKFVFNENTMDKNVCSILVMRNISLVPRVYVERIYDMKGSTDDREVLRKFPSDLDLRQKILKDMDFKKLEGRIHISREAATEVGAALIRDSEFFYKNNIMDYSLIIIKVNKAQYLQANGLVEKAEGDIYSIPSIKETGIYYHVGLIDYLQAWNMKKKAEKLTKKVLMQKKDPSAVEPNKYKERFDRLVKEITDISFNDIELKESSPKPEN